MEKSEKPQRGYTLRRLLQLVIPYKGLFIIAMVALAGGAGVNLALPELFRRILNADYRYYLFEVPLLTTGVLILIFAVQGLCFFTRSYLFGIIGNKVVAEFRRSLYAAIIERPISFFDQNRTGDLVSRLSSDTQLVQEAVSIRLSVLIRYLLQVSAGIVLMARLSLILTLTLVLLLPVLIGISIVLGKRLKAYSRSLQEELGRASSIAEETFTAARVVKAYVQEEREGARYNRSVDSVLTIGLARVRLSAFFASFVSFLMNAAIVAVLFFGIGLVEKGQISIGDLTAFIMYGVLVAVSFAFLSNTYAELVQGLGAAERAFEIIDAVQPQSTRAEVRSLKAPVRAELSFDNVRFSYPARQDVEVLKELSFQIPSGKTTALVGPSGAGKSTVVQLLLRFYDPTAGSIYFDGLDLRDIAPADLRSHIALVPQDPSIFAVSIRENLAYGLNAQQLSSDPQALLREACRKARILDFIEGLPQGFETLCGDRGIQLSGGQQQRLAIARAILKNPSLLLLDEATSALDSENEALVQEALQELMRGRTALVIAHRLSTIKTSDQVLVINAGHIEQIGTHDTLSAEQGLYRQLVEKQNLLLENGAYDGR